MKYPNCPTCGLNSMIEVEDCGQGIKIVACTYCDLSQDNGFVYKNYCWNCNNIINSRTSVQSISPNMGYYCNSCGKDLTEWKLKKNFLKEKLNYDRTKYY